MSDWFANPAFWEEMAFLMFRPERWEHAGKQVELFCELLRIEPGASVLDLCCGPGRHSLELSRRGFRVTGVDLHAPYLEQARASSSDVEWVQSDMREFRREGAFDGAVNLFTSFGYFEDPADDRRVVENVRASLRPGGAFLIDTKGKEPLAAQFRPRDVHRMEEDDALLIEERCVEPGWGAVRTKWTVLRGGRTLTHEFRLRIYSGVELERLLLDAGFASVDLHGALDGRPYDDQAARLVAVGRV